MNVRTESISSAHAARRRRCCARRGPVSRGACTHRRRAGRAAARAAQLAIARELGSASWPALVRRSGAGVGDAARARRGVRARRDLATGSTTQTRCWSVDPALARTLPAAALVLGEPVTVDPLVPLEPLGWLPLVYVAPLALPRWRAHRRARRVGRAPARRGRRPERRVRRTRSSGRRARSTARRASRTSHGSRDSCSSAARRPDDDESLYHATESTDLTCVRLLLDAGARVAGTNALAHALDREDMAARRAAARARACGGRAWDERDRAIPWAIFRNRSARVVRLLAEHGAPISRRSTTARGARPTPSPSRAAARISPSCSTSSAPRRSRATSTG